MLKKKESVEIEMTTGVSNSNVLRFSPDSDDEDDGRGYVSFSSRQPIAQKFFPSSSLILIIKEIDLLLLFFLTLF